MRTFRVAFTASALAFVAVTGEAATCTPTGFMRDGINLTAALVNPATVPATLDATGCNIGVYYDTGTVTLTNHDISGANYFGVVVNGDAGNVVAHITSNLIHNIGEVPFNGTQHGVALYIRAFFASTVTGDVTNNIIFAYQKGGIVLNGLGVKLSTVSGNQVFGLGHVDFIAQNGIQVGYGAMPYPGLIVNNVVSGNSFNGSGDGSSSGGILVVGGPGYGTCPDGNPCPYSTTVIIGFSGSTTNPAASNLLFNNDVGVYMSNLDADGVSPPPTPTTNVSFANVAGDDRCFNPYQAGISDQGNGDVIAFNYIVQGGGYGPTCGIGIDVTGSTAPIVTGNNVTATTTAATAAASTASRKIKISPVKP